MNQNIKKLEELKSLFAKMITDKLRDVARYESKQPCGELFAKYPKYKF
ncbi:MAG: hypothetical protein U5N58_03585 [Actinomycetota bacterium]|nr:hypothetical protein [Actinomycetota bacterium]